MSTISGKTVVVIGGSAGMGLAVAKLSLASLASKVVIASSTARLETAVKELEAFVAESKLPGKVKGYTLDGSSTDALRVFLGEMGEIDHLVWTGGDAVRSLGFPDPSIKIEDIKDMFDVRFWGPATCGQVANIRPGGSLTFTTGSVVFHPMPGFPLSASVGGAVDALTRGLAVSLAPKSVRVNSVCPGVVDTPIWNQMPAEMKAGYFAAQLPKQLIQHIGKAEEIAEAYVFLMKCTYITGQRIEVDGGLQFQ